MFAYQIDIYEKQGTAWGWHTLSGWTRPFTDGTRLDETLDSGTINLSNVTRDKAIKPFTRLRIIVKEGTGTNINNYVEKERIYRLVASTQRKRKRYAGTPLYDWTINTIELTKLLERRLIDTMTVTKRLDIQHIYDDKTKAVPEISGNLNLNYIHIGTVPEYDFLITKGTNINVPKSGGFYQSGVDTSWLTITGAVGINYKGAIVGNQIDNVYGTTLTSAFWSSDNATADNSLTYTFDGEGTYRITTFWEVYVTQQEIDTGNPSVKGSYTWTFSVYSQELLERTNETISSVCNRLLSAGVTRRKGVESQEFLLDPTFESEYENVLSPEFSFTNSTLFEALLQIGGYIHAIPRLVPRSTSDDTHYYVTFDKLGGDEQAPMAIRTQGFRDRGEYQTYTDYYYNDKVTYNGAVYYYKSIYNSFNIPPTNTTIWDKQNPLIYTESTIDVNDWCGQLDTPAQNLVNTEDTNAGSITELGNSFITVRTEDGQVEINADNVLIRVSKPIQQIVKIECGYVDGTMVGDITQYVYENAEYLTLSSYWGTLYPYSKAWAVYYTQGGNTINGLTFRWNDATDVQSKYANYAIVNIINAVTGKSLDWRNTASGEFMRKLAFRVTYVPIAQARVKAHKPSLAEGGAVNNALTYNQGANVAETSYYGEKMRGAIARLGHDVETRTYDIFHYDQLPKIGQLLDDKYIAHINYEWDITKVRITVALTKDFNMLSQFVGLNSNYRLYDISEKQSVERNVNYDELVVVGDAPAVDMETYLMNKNVSQMMYYTFNQFFIPSLKDQKLKIAKLTPYDTNSQEIPNRACILPAVAFPFGTSIALNVSYFDNYGAGYQQSDAFKDYQGDDNTVGNNKSVQRLVPYTDSLGNIAYLKVTFDKETGWTQNSVADYGDGSPAMLYPQLTTPDAGSNYVTTGDNYIDLQKDSREIINFTYQQHFVSTRPSIVLGSALAKYNPYVSIAETDRGVVTDAYSILWLPTTINGLNKYIDATNATIVDEIATVPEPPAQGSSFTFDAGEAPINCASYAVCKKIRVDSQWKYELLFGENITLTQGESAPTVTFAGALMQACNQDEPNRLRFAKAGTSYWYLLPSIGSGGVMGTLSDDYLPDYENPIVYGGGTQYQSVYYPIPGVYGTPPGSTVQKQAYVLASDLVTAYDFE